MSYSCNNNQSYFVEDGRTTSKVLREPGGGSSLSLGWDGDNSSRFGNDQTNLQNNGYRSTNVNLERKRRNNEDVTAKIGSPAPKQQPQSLANYAQPNQNQPHYNLPPQNAPMGANHNHQHLGLNVSSNKFANGGNQNCGNMITDRSSTRIHAPPGGRSQIGCLGGSGGWDDNAAPVQQRAPRQQPDQGAYNPYETTSGMAGQRAQQQQLAPQGANHDHQHLGLNVSSNAFANGGNQNCGNMITDRSSTRIHAPPGGHSSIHFG
jgi:SPIRAL1-like protein